MAKSFSQLLQQLAGIWKQLGINQRVSIIVAGIFVLAGLGAITAWSGRDNYSLLYGKLDEAEAGKVVAALEDANVPHRVGGGGAIYVPADKVHPMRMQLAAKGLPKGDGVGFEIFDKPSFGISDFVQRANYIRAVQGELARTIGQLDTVEAARVMIVMPESRLLVDSQRKPTASVFVRLRGNGELSSSSVNSIRFLVANSVEGLQPGSVSVVDNRGNVLTSPDDENSIAGLSAGQLNGRQSIEKYLSQKAQGMLEQVLGHGQAVVRVAVELNTETINRTEEKYDPDGQVARTSTSTEETNNSSTTSSNGGAVGLASNADGTADDANAAAEPPTSVTSTKRKTVNSQYEINRTVSTILQAPGGLKRVTAAVFVAAKTEGTGADRKTVTRTADELENLRKVVQSALGLQTNDPARKDEITLVEMPFNDTMTAEVAGQMQTEQTTAFWWEIGKNTGYALLAIAIVVLFLRMIKKAATESFNQAGNTGTGTGVGEPEVVTVEVLNRLIRENPSNMNQAVRSWMHQGQTANRN